MASSLVKQLLDAGVHFGHQTKRWHPKMKRFIFGSRSGIYIIDLEKTEHQLKAACDFIEDLTAKGQRVLFIGTKKQAKPILTAEAERTGMPFVVTRWLGGTLTNFNTIKLNIDRLRTLRKQKEDGFFERISKKDAKHLTRQMEKLEESFSGVVDLDKVPGAIFVVDIKREEIAIREANRLNIPIVAICDTNVDPELVTYPIPGNDDAIRSIKLIVGLIGQSISTGWSRYQSSNQPVTPIAAGNGDGAVPAEAAEAAAAKPAVTDAKDA